VSGRRCISRHSSGPTATTSPRGESSTDDVHKVLRLSYYTDIGRIAERGLLDSIFLADNIAIPEYRVSLTCRRPSSIPVRRPVRADGGGPTE